MVQGGGRVDNKACRRPRVGFYRVVYQSTILNDAAASASAADLLTGRF